MRKINIYHSVEDAPKTLPRNTVLCGDYLAALRKIADGSIDAVVIDPPYTDGKTDALPNHKIQTKVDIDLVFIEANRVLKDDGFICFFGIMPTVLAWLNAAAARFKFREHITWSKRAVTSPYLDIQRTKEELFIYAKGKPKYHETRERYEDLKMPALHLGYAELHSIKSVISDLQKRNNNAAYNMKYYSDIPMGRGDHNDKTLRYISKDRPKTDDEILDDTANNDVWRGAKLAKAERKNQDELRNFEDIVKAQKVQTAHGKGNDEWLQNKLPNAALDRAKQFEETVKNQAIKYSSGNKNDPETAKMYSSLESAKAFEETIKNHSKQLNLAEDRGTRERNDDVYNDRCAASFRYKSKQWCNILNLWAFIFDEKEWYYIQPVWSYLTQNQTKMGKDGENWKHPTVKPIRCLERLLKLILPLPNEDYTPIVLDFFGGTGTTVLAADNLGMDFICVEIIEPYFEIIVERLDKNDQNSVERFGANSTSAEPPKPKIIQQNLF